MGRLSYFVVPHPFENQNGSKQISVGVTQAPEPRPEPSKEDVERARIDSGSQGGADPNGTERRSEDRTAETVGLFGGGFENPAESPEGGEI